MIMPRRANHRPAGPPSFLLNPPGEAADDLPILLWVLSQRAPGIEEMNALVRAMVHAAHALMEAEMYRAETLILHWDEVMEEVQGTRRLTDEQRLCLRDESLFVQEGGVLKKRPLRLDFWKRFWFLARCVCAFVGDEFERDTILPKDIGDTVERCRLLRNRLTHPRTDGALDVTMEDAQLATNAQYRFARVLLDLQLRLMEFVDEAGVGAVEEVELLLQRLRSRKVVKKAAKVSAGKKAKKISKRAAEFRAKKVSKKR